MTQHQDELLDMQIMEADLEVWKQEQEIDLCPKCGVSRKILREMLTGNPQDRWTALCVVWNCPACTAGYLKSLRRQ